MRNSRRLRGRPSCMRPRATASTTRGSRLGTRGSRSLRTCRWHAHRRCGSIHHCAPFARITVSQCTHDPRRDGAWPSQTPTGCSTRQESRQVRVRRADNNRDINQRSVRRTPTDALGRSPGHRAVKAAVRVTLKARDPQGLGGSNPPLPPGHGPAGRSCSESMAGLTSTGDINPLEAASPSCAKAAAFSARLPCETLSVGAMAGMTRSNLDAGVLDGLVVV